MNDQVRDKLAEILRSHGMGICDNPRQVRALLADFCPGCKREAQVLTSALENRVVSDLLNGSSQLPWELLSARLVQRLCDELAMTEEAARWAVESWALVLGKMPAPQPAPPVPVETVNVIPYYPASPPEDAGDTAFPHDPYAPAPGTSPQGDPADPVIVQADALRLPRRRMPLGTRIGIILCVVPLCLLVVAVLWFFVWGGYERRASAAAAQQFLDDLLVKERVPLAYQRCSEDFRKNIKESSLDEYQRYPRSKIDDLKLLGTTMSLGQREVQVRFSCRLQPSRQVYFFVNMSKHGGSWQVDGFMIQEP